jgi:hypothetical protein
MAGHGAQVGFLGTIIGVYHCSYAINSTGKFELITIAGGNLCKNDTHLPLV